MLVLVGGLKGSEEGLVLQKESKPSFVGSVLKKIITIDNSIPLPSPRLVPMSGSSTPHPTPQKRETKKTQGGRTGFLGQSFLKDCLFLGGSLTVLDSILLRKVESVYMPHRLCMNIDCVYIGTSIMSGYVYVHK